MRTRVKVCGITREPDAVSAAQLGADAIGFIFWRPSPRYIEPELAGAIAAAGLYLTDVRYDSQWHLPAFARMMPFGLAEDGA